MNYLVTILLLANMLTLQGALHDMAVQAGVDPQLAACIVTNESHWDTQLVGDAQDTGLFQIIPSTAEWTAEQMGWSNYDLLDPVQNMEMGLWILKRFPEWYKTLPYCE